MAEVKFSKQLSSWLKSPGKKTFGDLEVIFQEKSFAVALLILLTPAALPIPTGGVDRILNIIALLIAAQMIIGRRRIWSPKFWQHRSLGGILQTRALPKLTKFIVWFEKHSTKRLADVFSNRLTSRLIGAIVFIFTLGTLVAVPFTGLDTLPAMGVIIISLSLILEDIILLLFGFGVGLAGLAVEISLSGAAWHHFIH